MPCHTCSNVAGSSTRSTSSAGGSDTWGCSCKSGANSSSSCASRAGCKCLGSAGSRSTNTVPARLYRTLPQCSSEPGTASSLSSAVFPALPELNDYELALHSTIAVRHCATIFLDVGSTSCPTGYTMCVCLAICTCSSTFPSISDPTAAVAGHGDIFPAGATAAFEAWREKAVTGEPLDVKATTGRASAFPAG